jgi:hypothetical protein
VLGLLIIKCSKQGGIMRPKKLFFTEEDKMEIKRLRKELEDRIVNSAELSEIYAGTLPEGGCGEQCMITCAHYCEPGCEIQCVHLCTGRCTDIMAMLWLPIWAALQ